MTDLEIDKTLALKVGWPQALLSAHGIVVQTNSAGDRIKSNGRWLVGWRIFSHKDWNVISPIAERYDCFPENSRAFGWKSVVGFHKEYADTPQKAIALAVIGATK